MHTAAREMVYVAEQGLMADGKNTLDPTWQEMLNHATAKVTEGRRDKQDQQHRLQPKILLLYSREGFVLCVRFKEQQQFTHNIHMFMIVNESFKLCLFVCFNASTI